MNAERRRGRAHPLWRAVWRLATVAVVGVAIASQWNTVVAAERRLGNVHVAWVTVALLAEVASFAFAAELQHLLLSAARVRLPRRSLVAVTYASSAVSSILPIGTAFSTHYTYRRLVRRHVSARLVAWLLIVSAILSGTMLALLGLVGAQLRGLGVLCSTIGVIAATITVAAAIGTVATLAWATRNHSRFDAAMARLGRMARYARRNPVAARRLDTPSHVNESNRVALGAGGWLRGCGLAAANWAADWAALSATFVALGLRVPWAGLLWAYVATQVAGSVPLLGCVGVAEGTMTVALACIGVQAGPAVAVVLVYRLLSFWITLPTGWAASRYLARSEGHIAGARPLQTILGSFWHGRDGGSDTATEQAADRRRCVGATGFEPVTSAV